jgi:hypothetical protein
MKKTFFTALILMAAIAAIIAVPEIVQLLGIWQL